MPLRSSQTPAAFHVPDHTHLAATLLPVTAPPDSTDSDFDGLTDADEEQLGTDPHNPDTDGDGLLDGLEVHKYHTNPLKADTDSDGISDGDEVFRTKTNPLNPDTDGDGLRDGDEVNLYHTDPLSPDTDGDGLGDYDEVTTYHTDPTKGDTDDDGLSDGDEINRYHTDPTRADTDGDGLSDYDEIMIYHTNPLKKDTDGDGVSDYDEVKVLHTDPLNPDTDDDGFNDHDDKCPLVAGIRETHGCPLQIGDTLSFGDVFFEHGSGQMQPISNATLSRIQVILQQYPNMVVSVFAPLDSTEDAARFPDLSSSRSTNVCNWLTQRGVPGAQLVPLGSVSKPRLPNSKLDLIVIRRRN